MPFTKADIPGLIIFKPVVFEDPRGSFFESFNQATFEKEGLDYSWIQDNQSVSGHGVVRGLHFQNPPHAQAKLVRVLSGRIWDVAVDIRKGSPFFGKYFGIELSSENNLQLLIPEGFAHGFSVLSEAATVLYKCNRLYDKASEGGIMYNDPALHIDWKLQAHEMILSEKDKKNPLLSACQNLFEY